MELGLEMGVELGVELGVDRWDARSPRGRAGRSAALVSGAIRRNSRGAQQELDVDMTL